MNTSLNFVTTAYVYEALVQQGEHYARQYNGAQPVTRMQLRELACRIYNELRQRMAACFDHQQFVSLYKELAQSLHFQTRTFLKAL